MEVVLVILLIINMAILAFIVLLCHTAISLINKTHPNKTVVYKAPVSSSTQTPIDEVEEQEEEVEDLTVPIEQFTPDFTKPIKVNHE